MSELSVIQPLELLSAQRFGPFLRLAVRDAERTRHVISFRFASRAHARRHCVRANEWIRQRTSLAYVKTRGECALIDVESLLRRATA